jgi:hypothetical protein
MTEQDLTPCRFTPLQKLTVDQANYSVFCPKLDHWVSIQVCLGCHQQASLQAKNKEHRT